MSDNRSRPINSIQKLAGLLSRSILFSRGRRLYEQNSQRYNLPLSRFDKLWSGSFLILRDYSVGHFPPTFEDQQAAYQAERDFNESLPGIDLKDVQEGHARKPFWGSAQFAKYSKDFSRLLRVLEQIQVRKGQRLLEVGCGPGWTAEFLAMSGFSVVGTTIAPHDVLLAHQRAQAFAQRGLADSLEFKEAPMESVDTLFNPPAQFDAAYAYEALHHAFDWRKAVQSVHRCLKPGGWLILANEPNVLHTCISYRVSRLSNTHEIGFRQKDLLSGLRDAGFQQLRIFAPRINNLVSQHWIAAQK
jgi:2-polyprenyl-3-methyl-5-hydroxy-6-metoxy-1,4-benzoquinol methylase